MSTNMTIRDHNLALISQRDTGGPLVSDGIPTQRVHLSEEERYPFFAVSDFYDASELADDLLDIAQIDIPTATLHRWGKTMARFEEVQKEMKQWHQLQWERKGLQP